MTSGTPRISPVNVARIDELSYSKAYKIYRERYANAGDFRFIFVGSFDKDKIKPLIETYIGGLPGNPDEKESWADLKIKPRGGRIDHYLNISNEDKSYVMMEFGSEIEYTLKNCITARLLGSLLSNILLVNIRERLGGVYTIQAIPRITRYPEERVGYTIQFVCDPARVEELKKEILKEITKLSKTGVSVKDMAVCINQAKTELEVARKTNDYWMGTIQELLFNNYNIQEFGNYSKILMAITPGDIKKMAEATFDLAQYKTFNFMPKR
jgi:zinc protease